MLVERKTRYLLMGRLPAHGSATASDKLREMVARLPESISKTLTWDQSAEMVPTGRFSKATGTEACFCDPARHGGGVPARTPTVSYASSSQKGPSSRRWAMPGCMRWRTC